MGSPSVNVEEEDLITHPESSLVDNLINHLPFEIHAPGYDVNPLDYCREHDIAYANSGDRSKADCLLTKRAFARLLSETATTNERSVALVTTCCMISKIAFDKFKKRKKETKEV